MHYFSRDYGHSKHDLPAPRVSDSVEGCREVAKRLWLYAQSVVSDHRALSTSLAEAESSSRCWENEARGSIERMARAEAKRDATYHDALMARMDADAARKAKARVESELARVQNDLAVVEEAR